MQTSLLFPTAVDTLRVVTHLQVVEGVELHQVVKSGEGLVGVLEIERGKWRFGIIKDVKICKILLLLRLPRNT